MLNAMTVDLEDWGQAVLDPRLPVTDCVVRNLGRLLDFLDRNGVRATFFALGRVCETHPQLLPRVAAAGHEIASHGYSHELIYHQTPAQFRQDVERSIDIIESQSGRRPLGYRAPAFSITAATRWAGPILSDLGFLYSSSVFPVRKKRYGIPDSPRVAHRWRNCRLIEFPLTTMRVCGQNLPVCGGGYMRLLPTRVHAEAIRRLNRDEYPAVVYLHPYELARNELDEFRRNGFQFSAYRHLMQSLWRSRVAPRLERLFDEFEFAPLSRVLQTLPKEPLRKAVMPDPCCFPSIDAGYDGPVAVPS